MRNKPPATDGASDISDEGSADYAVSMIRAGHSGPGLFQRIANLLSAALEWKVGADDVRQWLRRLSHSGTGPALVLALDGISPAKLPSPLTSRNSVKQASDLACRSSQQLTMPVSSRPSRRSSSSSVRT